MMTYLGELDGSSSASSSTSARSANDSSSSISSLTLLILTARSTGQASHERFGQLIKQ